MLGAEREDHDTSQDEHAGSQAAEKPHRLSLVRKKDMKREAEVLSPSCYLSTQNTAD
ncbi:hypothetical protein PAMP_005201 [Pampus punctatissimus]